MTDEQLWEAVREPAMRSSVRFLLGSPALADVLRAVVDAALAQPMTDGEYKAVGAQIKAQPAQQEPCSKCHGLGYYDEGHENDDGSMSGGNYVECEKCRPHKTKTGDVNHEKV